MAHQNKRAAPGADSTGSPPLYHPLTWRTDEPARFRGKGKRNARRAAIDRKRQTGRIDAGLFAVLVLAVLEFLLIRGAA